MTLSLDFGKVHVVRDGTKVIVSEKVELQELAAAHGSPLSSGVIQPALMPA